MNKLLATLGLVSLLSACSDVSVGTTTSHVVTLTGELSDCTYHEVTGNRGKNIHVIRCPNSDVSTTWRGGKANSRAVTIDEGDK